MKKKALLLILITLFSLITCSCLRETLDKRSGFSHNLKTTEDNIRQEDWIHAAESLKKSQNTWKGIKPFLQLDIDHDYVNEIENNFVKLGAYIECQERVESLATILLIQKNWESIGEM